MHCTFTPLAHVLQTPPIGRFRTLSEPRSTYLYHQHVPLAGCVSNAEFWIVSQRTKDISPHGVGLL